MATAGGAYRGLMILAGNSFPQLAADVARRVGVSLCDSKIYKNIERETQVEICDSLRGKDVFIIQTGSGSLDSENGSINDSIMELLIMCYACKTSSARSVTGVMPYLPYSKQSKMKKRGCITAKLVASMLAKAGMTHLITLDLYMKEIQGFFDFPVDNLRGSPFLIQYIQENIPDYRNAVIVARYPGVTGRANSFAERLRLALAVIHGEPKEESVVDSRHSPPPEGDRDSFAMPAMSGGEELGGTPSRHKANLLLVVPKEKPPLNVVGDVHGKIAIIVDDVIDEVDRIIACAKCLQERGAYKVYVVATHGLFSDSACELLMESPITEIMVTNTIPHDKHKQLCSKVKSIDISLLLAEAVRRIYYGESMSYLFRNIPLED